MDPNLFELENQKIYFKSSENMSELPNESVQLVLTSPPYWNVRDYGGEQIGFGQSYKEYISSLNRVWSECIRVLRPNGKIAINVQPLPIRSELSGFGRRIIQNIMHDIEVFMRKTDLYLSCMFYWDKAAYISNVSWGSYPYPTNIASNTSFEQIFVWVKRGKTRSISREILDDNSLTKNEWRHWAVRCLWDDISPVIKIDSKGNNRFGHSAPFPEEIPYRLIRMHTVEGERVLDPFLGSGTTLKVCRLTGRKGVGYEINKRYKSLIRNRILENWSIPEIEDQYKTVGSRTLAEILNIAYSTSNDYPLVSYDEFLVLLKNAIQKEQSNFFSKSFLNHVFKTFKKEKRKNMQKKLSDFLEI